MSEQIKDGTGSGYHAKVNANNRLYANAVTVSEDQQATKKSRSYNINTGIITLTDAADTPVIYFKNNEDEDFHITAIVIGVGPSTGGSGGIPVITVVRNPTAGTTVDNTNDVDIVSNRNFGSADVLVADVYKGATGETLTGGTSHIIFFQTSNGRLFATIDEIIPKDNLLELSLIRRQVTPHRMYTQL